VIGDRVVAYASPRLALDRAGFPACPDRAEIYGALQAVRRTGDADAITELVDQGFLAGAGERFGGHVAPLLRRIPPGRFQMGTPAGELRHFCGESPRHEVELPALAISRVPVTNQLFGLLDPARAAGSADQRQLPVVDVSWFDAVVFAAWVGCRLPSEAEWEYACGGGADSQWCCDTADRLPQFAWYSENSQDRPHPVGTREPNQLGLFDLHGNAWEWCQDDYAADFYARSPVRAPVNDDPARPAEATGQTHKVARGGGFYALDEMCRTRFRLHDPARYSALDLGFRIVASERAGAETGAQAREGG